MTGHERVIDGTRVKRQEIEKLSLPFMRINEGRRQWKRQQRRRQ